MSGKRELKPFESYESELFKEEIVEIKNLIADGLNNREIANILGIDRNVVSKIRTKKVWKSVSTSEPFTPNPF